METKYLNDVYFETTNYENFIKSMKNLEWTPLHCMVEKQDTDEIKKLLNQNTDINALDKHGRTPLSLASAKGDLQTVKLLLNSCANPNSGFPLHFSCEKNHVHVAQTLIENGADINLEREGNYPLLIAITNNHFEMTKFLIENGADLHVRDKDSETVLHVACDRGNTQILSLLIQSGSELDSKDKYDMTPLSICLIRQENKPELVKLLLENGASVNFVDNCGHGYLHNCDNSDTIKEILKYGPDPNLQNSINETPLYIKVLHKRLNCARTLLEFKADPNIAKAGGWTPLHIAANEGYRYFVKDLIRFGANVNVASAQNVTPLCLATRKGHSEIVEVLVQSGARVVPVVDLVDVNSNLGYFLEEDWIKTCGNPTPDNLENVEETDLIGWTLVHRSVWFGFYEMSCSLIERGFSVNSFDKYERTPLSLAAAKNNTKLLKLLLEKGADVNLGLPLHYAIHNEALDCISELVKHKCDINIKNKHEFENPALLEAVYQEKSEVVEALLNYNAEPNCTNKWKETPLEVACRNSDLQSVKNLIKHGADINSRNSCKDTPLITASSFDNLEIIKILLENGAEINAKDHFESTPLHNSVRSNYTNCALELIKVGAEINCDDEGETALTLAVDNENLALIQALLGISDIYYEIPGGWSVLHLSAFTGNLECLKELLRNHRNVNIASAENVLPIYLAAVKGHVDVVKLLLEAGSFVDCCILDFGIIRDESASRYLDKQYKIVAGNTPLLGACSGGFLDVVKVLIDRGASLKCVNSLGNNLLHEGVLSGSKELVEFLAGLNEDFMVKNKKFKTPLDLAKWEIRDVVIRCCK